MIQQPYIIIYIQNLVKLIIAYLYLFLSYLQVINTYFMKQDNQLQLQLLKLNLLAPSPLDSSFIMGYLAYALPSGSVPQIKPTVNNIINIMKEGFISSQNVLQLIVVLRFKIFMADYTSSSKRLVSAIDKYINELALDNQYLNNKYLAPPPKLVQKNSEGMGIECSICLNQIDYATLCFLSCNHMFHRQCFNQHAKAKIEDKNIPFHCPQEDCNRQITMEEISQFLNKAQREKYDEFMFQVYVEHNTGDTSWCPTPGCQAVFAFDQALTNYKCPTCKKHYCLRCKCQMHTGLTCQQYLSMAHLSDDERKFMVLAKGAKYKQCPNCKFWVEKNQGCDHMTCRCKYEFCYVCGGKYGACKCGRSELRNLQSQDDQQAFPSVHMEMPYPLERRFDSEGQELDLVIKAREPLYKKQIQLAREEQQFRKIQENMIEDRKQQIVGKVAEKNKKKLQNIQKQQKINQQQKPKLYEKQKRYNAPWLSRQYFKKDFQKKQKSDIKFKYKSQQIPKFEQIQKRVQNIIIQQKNQKIETQDPFAKTVKPVKSVLQLKQEKRQLKDIDIEGSTKLFKRQLPYKNKQQILQSKNQKAQLKYTFLQNKLNYQPYPAYKFNNSSELQISFGQKSEQNIFPEPKKQQ